MLVVASTLFALFGPLYGEGGGTEMTANGELVDVAGPSLTVWSASPLAAGLLIAIAVLALLALVASRRDRGTLAVGLASVAVAGGLAGSMGGGIVVLPALLVALVGVSRARRRSGDVLAPA